MRDERWIRQGPTFEVFCNAFVHSMIVTASTGNRVSASIRTLAKPACIAALLAVAGTGASLADSIVIVSSDNLYRPGDILTDSFVVRLATGESLRLLNPKTNKTVTLVGPYEGAIEKYLGRCRSGLGRCNDKEPPELGGSRKVRQ